MPRRIKLHKHLPKNFFGHENFLHAIIINKIMKNGKKSTAKKILSNALKLLSLKTNMDYNIILENAIRNVTPKVGVVTVKGKEANPRQRIIKLLPMFLSLNRGIRWIIKYARLRNGKSMSIKLADEILDASKNIGNSVKKKQEVHKLAEANKVELTEY